MRIRALAVERRGALPDWQGIAVAVRFGRQASETMKDIDPSGLRRSPAQEPLRILPNPRRRR